MKAHTNTYTDLSVCLMCMVVFGDYHRFTEEKLKITHKKKIKPSPGNQRSSKLNILSFPASHHPPPPNLLAITEPTEDLRLFANDSWWDEMNSNKTQSKVMLGKCKALTMSLSLLIISLKWKMSNELFKPKKTTWECRIKPKIDNVQRH